MLYSPGLARKLSGLDLLLSRPSGRGPAGLSQTAASLYRRVMLLTHTPVSLKRLWIVHEKHTLIHTFIHVFIYLVSLSTYVSVFALHCCCYRSLSPGSTDDQKAWRAGHHLSLGRHVREAHCSGGPRLEGQRVIALAAGRLLLQHGSPKAVSGRGRGVKSGIVE